jgi:hypothetical protein
MAGISKRERQDKEQIARLEQAVLIARPGSYAQSRLEATLRALRRTQDKRIDERKRALKAKQTAETPAPRYNVLPDNGRRYQFGEPGYVAPKPLAPVTAGNPFLPKQGETPAQTRARLERMAAE